MTTVDTASGAGGMLCTAEGTQSTVQGLLDPVSILGEIGVREGSIGVGAKADNSSCGKISVAEAGAGSNMPSLTGVVAGRFADSGSTDC